MARPVAYAHFLGRFPWCVAAPSLVAAAAARDEAKGERESWSWPAGVFLQLVAFTVWRRSRLTFLLVPKYPHRIRVVLCPWECGCRSAGCSRFKAHSQSSQLWMAGRVIGHRIVSACSSCYNGFRTPVQAPETPAPPQAP